MDERALDAVVTPYGAASVSQRELDLNRRQYANLPDSMRTLNGVVDVDITEDTLLATLRERAQRASVPLSAAAATTTLTSSSSSSSSSPGGEANIGADIGIRVGVLVAAAAVMVAVLTLRRSRRTTT
jgi:hypothetical protein